MRSCFRVSVSELIGLRRQSVCAGLQPVEQTSPRQTVDSIFRCLWCTQLIATSLLISFAGNSLAQDTQSDAQPAPSRVAGTATGTLQQIDITAGQEGVGQTGDVVADEHTGSRSRIPYFRLEQPGSQLADLLSSITGVQQRQTGGFGTYSSITVRASSAAQTAVYLDGILLNSGGEPIVDLSTLELLNLASVDLYRGSSPLQLGHGGMGGAVNLNTLGADSDTGRKTRLRVGFGSFGHVSALAATSGAQGQWDWTTSASHQQSRNDFPFFNDNGTELNTSDDRTTNRRNNDVKRSAMLAKAGYQASGLAKTDVLLQLAARDMGVPDVLNSIANQARFETIKSQLQISQTIDEWHNWNTRHSVYWHENDTRFDDRLSQIGLGSQLLDSEIRTLGAKTYWERFVSAGTAGLSVDLREESIDLRDELEPNDNLVLQRQLLLATAHMAILDDQDRWMLTPALRWQQSEQKGKSISIGASRAVQPVRETEFGAQLGAAYYATPQVTLSFNAGNYFRQPSFGEMFGSIGLINGNPTLESEEGINTDVGIRYTSENVQLNATVFHNQRDQLIITSFDARGIGRPRNTGKAEVSGVELEAYWKPSAQWQINANMTYQNPRNRNPFSNFSSNILPGEARRTAFARVQYQPSNIAYWYEWQATRELFYDSDNNLPATDSSLHSVGFNWQNRHWQLGGTLRNIRDDNVEDFNGFPKPGRHFSIAVTRNL